MNIIALNESLLNPEILISKPLAHNLFIAEKVDVIARIEGRVFLSCSYTPHEL